MERRRLAVLCSHLRQIDLDRPIFPQRLGPSVVSHAPTSSCSNSAEESEKGSEEKDCIFCMIIRGESPAFKLYEDDLWVCILDSNPLSHGHSLVIPKSHYSSLGVTPPSVVAAMFYKVPFLSKAIMKATHCDSFNLLVNNGAAAGQVIFHTHLHIIPRKACDQLWTHQSFRRRPLKPGQDTASLADCIREWLLLPANSSESFQGAYSQRKQKCLEISQESIGKNWRLLQVWQCEPTMAINSVSQVLYDIPIGTGLIISSLHSTASTHQIATNPRNGAARLTREWLQSHPNADVFDCLNG